ncbi:unnamed protein product [Mytilus coruscus]|uniref:Reverse transcriptase/retrotransposon-derived protein RNase H-like domain-containing protein n=1 Tax=Mytilus coruscus TaxID=42192 RepID=A0A6J7ZZM6_MYTCO|nr:unnamed protein product [Mytilus coruscus]
MLSELGIKINENLYSNQRKQLPELLTRTRKVFAKDITEFGTTDYHYHINDTGHILSKNGIKVDPEKTSAVQTYPVHTKIKHLRSFLGPCSYYRKFVLNYLKIVTPLTQFTQKDKTFILTQDCQKAFQVFKHSLVSDPILVFPDFKRRFVLSVDAPKYAIGYVLGQLNPNTKLEHVVAYGGRTMSKNEQKWHINEKEGLALKEGIKHFNLCLATQKFTVYTCR